MSGRGTGFRTGEEMANEDGIGGTGGTDVTSCWFLVVSERLRQRHGDKRQMTRDQ